MKIIVRQLSPTRLLVCLSYTLGTRRFGSALGTLFVAFGLVFVFASLPHREQLRCTRAPDQTTATCTRSQLLAGRWVMHQQRLLFGRGSSARVVHERDEGSNTFHGAVEGPAGRLRYGKTHRTRTRVQAGVQQVNAFFDDAEKAEVTVRENVWWWYVSPFGVIAVLLGLGALAWFNETNHWIFDHAHVRQEDVYVLWRRVRHWPRGDVNGVRVAEETDSDGDPHCRLLLQLRSGASIALSSTLIPAVYAPQVREAAQTIERFLESTP